MTVALIVAAGSGERLGAGVPKAYVELAGRPMLQWSVDALMATKGIEEIVVALPPGGEPPAGTVGVTGGSCRSESVARGLEAARPSDAVLVHDAARPLLTAELAESVIAALAADERADAAIAAAPVTDTIKRAGRRGGEVRETLDRGELWAIQTPQVFRRGALERGLEVDAETLASATDDAWLIERSGGRVLVVPCSAENIKVTTPFDLRVAELLLGDRGPAPGTESRAAHRRAAVRTDPA
jgi:2-C-methyl-D-erythritol 4-phosphate cytidylyltransferase